MLCVCRRKTEIYFFLFHMVEKWRETLCVLSVVVFCDTRNKKHFSIVSRWVTFLFFFFFFSLITKCQASRQKRSQESALIAQCQIGWFFSHSLKSCGSFLLCGHQEIDSHLPLERERERVSTLVLLLWVCLVYAVWNGWLDENEGPQGSRSETPTSSFLRLLLLPCINTPVL